MDITCRICGEPWDMDSLHEEAQSRYGIPYYANDQDRAAYRPNPAYSSDDYQTIYHEVVRDFQTKGCHALTSFGSMSHCAPRPSESATIAGALYDLLGDDLDGAAATLQDYGL